MYWQHTLEFNTMLNDCGEMFCEVSEAAAKPNSILKWVEVRNCSYKTNIVKIHAGIHCWLLGEGEGVSSSSNNHWCSSPWIKTVPCAWSKSVQNNTLRNVICSKYQSWFKTIYHWSWYDEHMDLKLNEIHLKFLETAEEQEQSLSLSFQSKQHLAWNLHGTQRFHVALN